MAQVFPALAAEHTLPLLTVGVGGGRGPLSLGDAYLQRQSAVYQASLGWQDSPEFLLSHAVLAKHGFPPGFSLPQLAEVVWPGAQVGLPGQAPPSALHACGGKWKKAHTVHEGAAACCGLACDMQRQGCGACGG